MSSYRIISSDSHVFEPVDLWTSRIEPKFRDRCPRMVRTDRGDYWYCDGKEGSGVGPGAQAGFRFDDPDKLSHVDIQENVRPGGYVPGERLKDMDLDGIDVDMMYPTAGLFHYRLAVDGELLSAILGTYNDWLAEFCKPYPDRLKGIGMINIDDVDEGVRELERCANLGLVGAMIPTSLAEGKSYALPDYEPLWAAAQDLRVPLSLHIGTSRSGPDENLLPPHLWSPSVFVNLDPPLRDTLCDMIFAGVFERYPELRVGSIENELVWAAHFLEQMDFTYSQRPPGEGYRWRRFEEDMLPSDYFHRNVFLSFQESALGVRLRDVIGVDGMLWGSDYPHFESTFPRSRETLEGILADCTEEEKVKIAGGNAARVYNLN